MSGSQGMHSPVAQFEIKPLIELSFGGYDLSFTNSSLFMMLAIGVSGAFLISAMRRGELVPGRMQGLAEMMHEFVAEMVRSNVGHEGRPYFPFIFTLFVFLLFGNMLGLIPYSYTFTSQIVVTFAMAAFVFVGVTLIALFKHGLHFFSFFVPAGAPKVGQCPQTAGRFGVEWVWLWVCPSGPGPFRSVQPALGAICALPGRRSVGPIP